MRIVAFAYACEPGRGSEPGAGWVWARMLARLGDATVITRANNRASIEAAIGSLPEHERPTFVYVDLPEWARRWKRKQRGIRLYYLLWQFAALRAARELHRRRAFDVAWHLTLANVWMGSAASLLPVRFVYGPVGGGVSLAWPLLPTLGWHGVLYELTRAGARAVTRFFNPLARSAWRKADVVLVQNTETAAWLPRSHRAKAVVFPNAVLDETTPRAERGPDGSRRPQRREGKPTVLFAGNLLPLKGVALAIDALRWLDGWQLVVCGEGPDRSRLEARARRRGLEDRVQFLGQVPRPRLLEIMRCEADVFLFPSLHDQSPWVVAEALASGLPVVCLDRGGSTVLGGTGVPVQLPRATARDLARHVLDARPAVPPSLDFESRADALRDLLAASVLGDLLGPAHHPVPSVVGATRRPV